MRGIEQLRFEVQRLENDWSGNQNWSLLLRDLAGLIEESDVDGALGFLDDIQEAVDDLPIKVRRADQAMRMAINPILKNTPVYFDAEHPPENSDYLNPPTKE